MCGIVVALPAYGGRVEQPDLTSLVDLLPSLPDLDGFGGDRDKLESTLHMAAERLAVAVDAYATTGAVLTLANTVDGDPLRRALHQLECTGAELDEALDRDSAAWGADATERVQRMLREVRDQIWTLRHDRVAAAARARALATAGWTPHSVTSYVAVNSVLDALDRLEVRGRDSAGISIWVDLAPEDRARLTALPMRDDPQFRSGSTFVTDHGVCFVYKRAAIVGRLGDNTRHLREAIAADEDLHWVLNLPSAKVTVLAHTRWASVGRVSEANAHPVDNRDPHGHFTGPFSIAVLNGDVDNYTALQERCGYVPDEAGVTTDAKLLPLLLSAGLDDGLPPADAMRAVLEACHGSMAIAAQSDRNPGEVLLATKGSGQALYVGFGPQGYFVASEAYGLVGVTRQFTRMDGRTWDGAQAGGTVMLLRRDGRGRPEEVRRWDAAGVMRPVTERDVREAEVTTRDLAIGEFEHYLQKEIHDAASSFRKTLRGRVHVSEEGRRYVSLPDSSVPRSLREQLRTGRVRKLVLLGQGTAAVAGTGIAHVAQSLVGDALEVVAQPATEFSAWGLRQDLSDTCVVAVSQSGTTTDTNRAVDMARASGATVLCIVNRRDSDLAEKSDGVVYTADGRDVELSVASTKAFYSQVAAGCLLVAEIAKELGCLAPTREESLLHGLTKIPEQLQALHRTSDRIAAIAAEHATRYPFWSVVGSGANRVAAEEVRIKASELCYRTISADAVENKKHIDLSAEALVLVCVAGAPPHQLTDLIKEIEILNAHRNHAIVICDQPTEHLWPKGSVIPVPAAHPELAWILGVAAGHLFSYHAARAIDAAADPVRRALSALETAVDQGATAAGPLPVEVTLQVKRMLAAAARGELRGVLTSQAVMALASIVLPLGGVDGEDFAADRDRLASARAALTTVLEELGRPIDTVRHQAKTVTVGTSRADADLYENDIVRAMVEAGTELGNLTYVVLDVIRAHARVVRRTTGVTRYEIRTGANGEAELRVVNKTGIATGLASRADAGAPLTGSKRRVAELRVPRLVRGQFDRRIVLIVPEQVAGEVAAMSVVHLELRDPCPLADLQAAMNSVGDRLAEIVAAATEIRPDFVLKDLVALPVETVLLEPVDEVAEALTTSTR